MPLPFPEHEEEMLRIIHKWTIFPKAVFSDSHKARVVAARREVARYLRGQGYTEEEIMEALHLHSIHSVWWLLNREGWHPAH